MLLLSLNILLFRHDVLTIRQHLVELAIGGGLELAVVHLYAVVEVQRNAGKRQMADLFVVVPALLQLLGQLVLALGGGSSFPGVGDTQSIADYRIESLQSSLHVQQHAINEKIAATTDASIKTMRIAQLEAAQELCEKKIQKIEDAVRQTDLHVKLLANGIVEVRR